jgi:hypothetical protein
MISPALVLARNLSPVIRWPDNHHRWRAKPETSWNEESRKENNCEEKI